MTCGSEKLLHWCRAKLYFSPWPHGNMDFAAIFSTFPRSSCRPRICAAKTPMPIKILGTRPKKPRRFLGAISPRYIGTTLREMPAVRKAERKIYVTMHWFTLIKCCIKISKRARDVQCVDKSMWTLEQNMWMPECYTSMWYKKGLKFWNWTCEEGSGAECFYNFNIWILVLLNENRERRCMFWNLSSEMEAVENITVAQTLPAHPICWAEHELPIILINN